LQELKKHLDKFSNVKVLVIGDVMLDRYQWGTVSRISPEAPVPIVTLEKESVALGGAANVALNIIGLGAKVYLFGLVGDDPDGKTLSSLLHASDISAEYLSVHEHRQTTVKTRIIAHNQQVVRLDQEKIDAISDTDSEVIVSKIQELLDEIDVVVVSDYAKGLLTDNLLASLIAACGKRKKKILIDPKGKDYTKYRGATILTPNQKEAVDACSLDDGSDDLSQIAGNKLLEDLSAEAILITLGEKGMILFQPDSKIHRFDALARKVYDVTGAGDTVIATLAVGIGASLNFVEAAEIANIAAGLVVEQIGTTAINKEMLEQALET
jgi:rfaE bifunctional protein kinase chain/domain